MRGARRRVASCALQRRTLARALTCGVRRSRVPCAQAGADGGLSRVGEQVTVRGWVRTVRAQKTFAFIEVRSFTHAHALA